MVLAAVYEVWPGMDFIGQMKGLVMRTVGRLVIVALVAVFVGMGVSGCRCPMLKKSEAAASAKCAKCGMDKSACKCAAAAPAKPAK